MGILFRWMGGIPVHRDKRTSMVDQVIKQVNASEKFHLAITPEGTRSPNPNWKKGFYYIALGANIPIVLIGIDYEKKCITAGKYIIPSGDIDKDMRENQTVFQRFQKEKHPHKIRLRRYRLTMYSLYIQTSCVLFHTGRFVFIIHQEVPFSFLYKIFSKTS